MDQEIVLDPVQGEEGLVINCLQDYRCCVWVLTWRHFFAVLRSSPCLRLATVVHSCTCYPLTHLQLSTKAAHYWHHHSS